MNSLAVKANDDRFGFVDVPFYKFVNGDLVVCEDHSAFKKTRIQLFREP